MTANLPVDINVCDAPADEMTVGAKRQHLLNQADGAYVCFVDDDDTVSPGYVKGILQALESRPQCVAIHGDIVLPGGTSKRMLCSIKHWKTHHKPLTYKLRPAGHLNPVRIDLARQAGFVAMDNGEDADYAHRLGTLIRDEVEANAVATRYCYRFDPEQSATFVKQAAYRNRFGDDFRLSMTVESVGQPFYVSLGHLNIPVNSPAGCRHVIHAQQEGKDIRVGVDDKVQTGGLDLLSIPTVFSIVGTGNQPKVRNVNDAHVGKRKVVLRYDRKGYL